MLWLSLSIVLTAFIAGGAWLVRSLRPAAATKRLYFESGRSAFDYHCKYGEIALLRHGCIRLGLIEPAALTADPDGFQSAAVKIADRDKPFLCRGTTAVPNAPPLQGGQLVYWYADRYDPRLSKMVSDPRSCWEGSIFGVCAPEMITATGYFRVVTDTAASCVVEKTRPNDCAEASSAGRIHASHNFFSGLDDTLPVATAWRALLPLDAGWSGLVSRVIGHAVF